MQFLELKNKAGNLGNIHFVGIGGIGMSGIAELMHNLGYKVQGSDQNINTNITKRLKELGIKIFDNHAAENIIDCEVVVISSAIKADNIEVQRALELNIPVIRRAEMLAELMRFKTSIAVSGTHGKTTTTSFVSNMLENANLKPTVINGGIINNKHTNAYLGDGNYLVAEADESDATFINIPATIAVITNIDADHLDFYGNFENYYSAFRKFIQQLPFYGFAVACIDCDNVKKLVAECSNKKIITYGFNSEANFQAINIEHTNDGSKFDVLVKFIGQPQQIIENILLPSFGLHNISNALAAIAVGYELQIDNKLLIQSFNDFKGIKRRFTHLGDVKQAMIVDDYAHHPKEIKVTIATAKQLLAPENKLITIFQPHRYSRLANLFSDFQTCFDQADICFILDVYAAGEQRLPDINSQILVEAIKGRDKLEIAFIENNNILYHKLLDVIKPGDIVLFMGAGDITKLAYNFVEENKELNELSLAN